MSGKFYIGVALLLALALGCVFVGTAVGRMEHPVNRQVETAIVEANTGDLHKAVAALDRAMTLWESHKKSLASLSNHGPMDDIETLLAETISYGKSGLREEFLAGCKQLTLLLRSITEDHRLTWWNLLSRGIFPNSLP